jgi:hypothetical protein
MSRLLALAALFFVLPAHANVTIDWVTVGGPGNACDTQGLECFGAVAYTYQISKYEITNAQYTEFLNAVAATDPNGLYEDGAMSGIYGGITRSGNSGSYTYSAITGRENNPVNFVDFQDTLRFANWLHNDQPTGDQDSTTTEDGAYTMITESYPDGPFITRNADARVFITSEDEWYKAAYYDPGTASYYDYPAGSDTQTTCVLPGTNRNTANCAGEISVGDTADVGSYTGSASPNGTFDQGGNVWEWNEAIVDGWLRGIRGGSFEEDWGALAASVRVSRFPYHRGANLGFRIAKQPPPIPTLSPLGLRLVAAGLLGFGVYRRGRA